MLKGREPGKSLWNFHGSPAGGMRNAFAMKPIENED